jgi:hypothetical protein
MITTLMSGFRYVGFALLAIVALCLLVMASEARDGREQVPKIMVEEGNPRGDLPPLELFGVAQAGTTWIGWLPGAYDPVTNPFSVGPGGVWDFDDRGTRPCPVEDGYQEYIKNGAYAQGWTSEDVLAQKGLYWNAQDFSDPAFSCQGNAALSGAYSAWCGLVTPDAATCFTDAPGYGHNWNQWLCRVFTNPTGLSYIFKSDTEPGFDYAYVIIDRDLPDSCGWSGDNADTVRCYDDTNGPASVSIDLTNLPGGDPDFCADEAFVTSDYSGDTVKICFVLVSDSAWDDEDGEYATCDGGFTVDDILVTTTGGSDTTTFESGTLEGWTSCGGFSPGDYVAVRSASSFHNNDACGLESCDMSGCVLTYFNPDIPGQYGTGGHYAGDMHKRAWSPAVNVSNYPPRGYVLRVTQYIDLPIPNWIFKRYYVRYVQNPECPTGAWSRPMTDGYIYPSWGYCTYRTWGFSQYVPADADSVKVGYSIWNGCNVWETPCTNGNDSPVIDNFKLGIFDLSYPAAYVRSTDNYTDAFPEDDALGGLPSSATALMDIANNRSQEGYFLRLGDTAYVRLEEPDVKMEFCFRVVPGPGTDTSDPWFAKYGESGISPCDTTAMHCTRMDTAFAAGDGDTTSAYETQVVFDGYWATMIHEDDLNYVAEGEEILPDSLFTPGSRIFYAFRSSFFSSPGNHSWLPFGADPTGTDLSGWYEIMVLPDQCKDPPACLLYVDYYNRGAQRPIEEALTMLGRTWDRYDMRAESSHQGNGIGNRVLGPGRYRLARGPIGPSLDHMTQYRVMMINTGNFNQGVVFSDGGRGTPDDPSNDITFMDNWLSEGTYRGLWLNGNSIASDFSSATGGSPKPAFLNRELATDLVHEDYRYLVGHSVDDKCHRLSSGGGRVVNTYSVTDSMSFVGSGCPQLYDFDVIEERDAENGHEFVSLMYDDTGATHPPGYYASVDHIFRAPNAPFDTVRTKIDGFSMHNLRMNEPACGGADNVMIALWIRDVLGGVANDGYFFDTDLQVQYCPPVGPETVGIPGGRPGGGPRNALFQNYPNPFRGGRGTTIHYSAAKVGGAKVYIFDAAGRLVRTLSDKAALGDNYVVWDGVGSNGRRAPSGVYFYEIEMDGFSAHKKMLLVR